MNTRVQAVGGKAPRIVRIALSLALLLSTAGVALAGIEEHSPDPEPGVNSLDGIIMGRSMEGVEKKKPTTRGNDEPVGAITPIYDETARSLSFRHEMMLKWELARYGVEYLSTTEVAAAAYDAPAWDTTAREPDPRRHPTAADKHKQERGEAESCDYDETSSPLLQDEASSGCSASGAGPARVVWPLLLIVFGLTILRTAPSLREMRVRPRGRDGVREIDSASPNPRTRQYMFWCHPCRGC